MQKPLRVASLIAVTVSVACLHHGRRPAANSPASPAAAPVAAPARPTVTYRPVHKGGADISTGLYTRTDDDLVLNTSMPVVLNRTYLSNDHTSRQFGVGAMHDGEWWIRGDSDPGVPWGELILADRGRIRFTRISPGNTQAGAVLRHDTTPTEFNGALLSWNGSLWEMRFRDGALAFFLDCQRQQDVCSVVERRDSAGHSIAFTRDATGRLQRMDSEGQSIAFDYDDHKRIVRAYDTSQHVVRYTYDDKGRLIRASSSDGTTRDYTYDERDGLIGVREPGRILKNWYDESGRWIRQEVRSSDFDNDPYVATARYIVEHDSIVQADFDDGNGVERLQYNARHYIVSDTFDADSPAPITFTYDRDITTNEVKGATISCVGPEGPVTRSAPLTPNGDARGQRLLMRQTCLARGSSR